MSQGELVWRKASASTAQGSDCVEVAALPRGGRALRDSKRRDDGAVAVASGEWVLFVGAIRAGLLR